MMDDRIKKWRDPLRFREGVQSPRSSHILYASRQEMEEGASSLRMSLDGLWYFHYAKNPSQAVEGFWEEGFDAGSWDTIQVPGHVQLQGYGRPQYTNTQYPWEGREAVEPGQIPQRENGICAYVRYFRLPEHFAGHRLLLVLAGAESGASLWCNGHYVGYGEDSFTPSEFDISAYVRPGENKLAIELCQWTAGSWCEDQDFWRFSGLFRSVYLEALPGTALWDIRLEQDYDCQASQGRLGLGLQLEGRGRLEAALYGPYLYPGLEEQQGEDVLVWQTGVEFDSLSKEGEDWSKRCRHLALSASLEGVRPWSSEHPYLYRLELRIDGESGLWSQIFVGFRHFALEGGLMRLNGQRMVFKGVNRHEFGPAHGRTPVAEDVYRDLLTIKQNNINALRTSHYPNGNLLYDLCDRLGLYVIAENNMETHGSWEVLEGVPAPGEGIVPDDKTLWEPLLLDRVRSCYQRDKNHACILIWSIGNESYGGEVPARMAELFRQLDSSRLVHYESCCTDRRYPHTTDMESRMYVPAQEIREFLQKHRERPMISCEYAHAMGNSCGALDRYVALTREEPLYQGGFVWDFKDQALYDSHGNLAYGGDFGDRPHDGNFCGNGLVYADGTSSTKMAAVKYVYQPFLVEWATGPVLRLTNELMFTHSRDYRFTLEMYRDGVRELAVDWEPDIGPGESRDWSLPMDEPVRPGEYVLRLVYARPESSPWAPDWSEESGFGEWRWMTVEEGPGRTLDKRFGLHPTAIYGLAAHGLGLLPGFRPLEVAESRRELGVLGEGFSLMFAKQKGQWISYRRQGREYLPSAPKPCFWRAPTDNDLACHMPIRYRDWKLADLYARPRFLGWERQGEAVCLHMAYALPWQDFAADLVLPREEERYALLASYRIQPQGRVEICLRYRPERAPGPLTEMPLFGWQFALEGDLDHMEWYGYGPGEAYADRCHGQKLGLYQCAVADSVAGYLRPQEMGNRMGVSHAKVYARDGHGLAFLGRDMDFCALPYTPAQLEEADHLRCLPQSGSTYVRLALGQMGVGGDDTWGSRPHAEYLLPAGELEFSFAVQGV